jgi:tetratricopeptide (TPR) repeat protein
MVVSSRTGTGCFGLSCLLLLCSYVLPAAESKKEEDASPAFTAFALRLAGRSEEAKGVLQEAVSAGSRDARVHFELARILFYTSVVGPPPPNLRPAREAVEKAVELDAENPRYHFWAGLIAGHQGIVKAHASLGPETRACFQASISHIERTLRLKPDYHEARNWLLGNFARLPADLGGDRAKAEKQAKMAEKFDPVWGAVARCQLIPRGNKEDRIAVWRKVIAANKQNARAHEGFGCEYLNQGKTKKAIAHLERALKLDPKRSVVLLDLASHLQGRKDLVRAEQAISRFLTWKPAPIAPLRARGLRRLSRVLKQAGKTAEAEAAMAEAEKLDPVDWAPHISPEELYGAP